MTFSYDATLAAGLDQVRFLLGDTEEGAALFTDEEIGWILTQQSIPTAAAAFAARRQMVRYANKVDHTIGDAQVSASQQFEHWRVLAAELAGEALTSLTRLPLPYAGGISQGDKDTRELSTDRALPYFTRRTADGSYPALNLQTDEELP